MPFGFTFLIFCLSAILKQYGEFFFYELLGNKGILPVECSRQRSIIVIQLFNAFSCQELFRPYKIT